MFKYLIPLLFISTVAFGQDANLSKLHHHFDPLATEWDGTLQTVSPVLAKVAPLPVTTPELGGKCTTDDLKTVSDYFHSFGYTALIVAKDKSRDNVRDEVMYNLNDNSILALSLFFDKPVTGTEDDDSIKLVKICTEFQAVKPNGDGPTFKKFVLGQRMEDLTDIQKQSDEEKRKNSSLGGDPMKEPYQGDPSKVHYIPLD